MNVERRRAELRVFGLNACLAVFARRPVAIRKVYLLESRMPVLREVLRWCADRRLGYRLVAEEDLRKLTGSQHHEGVCFDVLRPHWPDLAELLERLPATAPVQLVFAEGVGNPHNLGAILRSCAHFGVRALLVDGQADAVLSGAACRVAEGAAEAVPVVGVDAAGWRRLASSGFTTAATVVRDGVSLHDAALPPRIVWMLGAEGSGLSAFTIGGARLRLTIPGTGQVESLNVSAAAAVLLSEHARQHGVTRPAAK